MKERFEGIGRPSLIAALEDQVMVRHDRVLAERLANAGEVVEFSRGIDLIRQAGGETDVYFILIGVVSVIINHAEINKRRAGEHVGEMAALDVGLPRSATITALEPVVALKVGGPAFMAIADEFPAVWIPVAKTLARRLSERNRTIFVPNTTPNVFIISSSEALQVADAVAAGLAADFSITRWNQGVFFAGGYTLEALEAKVLSADFAIAVAQLDDVVRSRDTENLAVRDNVVFELGLFMGKITRHRAVLMHPKVKGLVLPSDFQGLTAIRYEEGDVATVAERMKEPCEQLRELIKKTGVRKFEIKDRD